MKNFANSFRQRDEILYKCTAYTYTVYNKFFKEISVEYNFSFCFFLPINAL